MMVPRILKAGAFLLISIVAWSVFGMLLVGRPAGVLGGIISGGTFGIVFNPVRVKTTSIQYKAETARTDEKVFTGIVAAAILVLVIAVASANTLSDGDPFVRLLIVTFGGMIAMSLVRKLNMVISAALASAICGAFIGLMREASDQIKGVPVDPYTRWVGVACGILLGLALYAVSGAISHDHPA